jgi:DNA replication protein DnaC
MHSLKNARVLFIDDLLKGKVNESDINIMYEIINFRYLQRTPIIISTEKSIEELLAFDEAIASRLIEMSKGNIITFDDSVPNYRLR